MEPKNKKVYLHHSEYDEGGDGNGYLLFDKVIASFDDEEKAKQYMEDNSIEEEPHWGICNFINDDPNPYEEPDDND